MVALALVGQGIWLVKIYRDNHANDFEITTLENPVIPAEAGIQINTYLDPDFRRDDKHLTWSSQLVSQSTKLISAAPGKPINLSATFENTGTATWTRENTFLQILTDDEADISPWYSPTWIGKKRVAAPKQESVTPETQGTFEFMVTAPSVPNTYTISLRPVYTAGTTYHWLGVDPRLHVTITVGMAR